MKRVISYKNRPATLPLWQTLTIFLMMDRFNAPGWLWGVIGTIVVLWWIGAIANISKQKEVDIFETGSDGKSKFQQRLEDIFNASELAKKKSNN
jgi:hypothetical protein